MDFQRPIIPFGGGIWLQLFMNLVPFLGVVYYDWSVFALIYSFWLETLAMSFFDAIKIAFARGGETKGTHFIRSFRFLFARIAILMFYMIFMIVFVGIIVSGTQKGNNFAVYLTLTNDSFRITILSFFVIKLVQLIYNYFIQGEYKTALPEYFSSFFSGRIIIIHVVIVLGVFAFQFFAEKVDQHSGVGAFAGVFIIIKSLADLISFWLSSNKEVN